MAPNQKWVGNITYLWSKDRGSQYCATQYQLLTKYALVCSMSVKGNCYDNACAKSFSHTMKAEAFPDERFYTRKEMRRMVFEYIEVDYNRNRHNSANGRINPEAFEAK